jgi:NADPH-dependent 2,4-dienoyl-CoA reductase/sulfur reductase-like enzyme
MAADTISSVVIVGASVAGLHTAEQLRAHGFTGDITVVGLESHLPYDRPPLSKQLLVGTRTQDDIALHAPAELDRLGVQLRLGVAATGWDGQHLQLADGRVITADRLVVATGVRPRALAGQPDHPALGPLRTVDDAAWLAERLRAGGTVVVVGGGFIGAEVASAARQLGCAVVMIEATEYPMQRVLGDDAARLLAEVLADAGIDYRGGRPVTALRPDGDVVVVELGADSVRADTVVIGIGTVPETAWLGVDGPTGIECDERGRARAIANAYAVGDVAAWPDPHGDEVVRVEHWTSARNQAAAVAADIAGVRSGPAAVPAVEPEYFWTDQFGLKIQLVGNPARADRTVLVRAPDGAVKRSVVLYLRGDVLVAGCLFSSARLLAPLTELVRTGADATTALALFGRPGE